jgi:hypothetical protein
MRPAVKFWSINGSQNTLWAIYSAFGKSALPHVRLQMTDSPFKRGTCGAQTRPDRPWDDEWTKVSNRAVRNILTAGPEVARFSHLAFGRSPSPLNSLAAKLAPLKRSRKDMDPTYAARGEIAIRSAPISRRRCIRS